MSAAVLLEFAFEPMTCGGCGVAYAMTREFVNARRQDHRSFYCPNGCCRAYHQRSEVEELKLKLERAERNYEFQKNQRLMTERSNVALKGQVTKVKNKLVELSDHVAKGVCPCCKRSFENLRRHMQSKHPNFVEATKHEE